MFKHVLVATDGSDLSSRAVTAAVDLASLAGAELVPVTVAHLHAYSTFEGAMVLNQREAESAQEQANIAPQRLSALSTPPRRWRPPAVLAAPRPLS